MSGIERQNDEIRKPRSRYLLIFESFGGEKFSWWLSTSKEKHEIPGLIENATNKWAKTPEGQEYIRENELEEWGIDYANALRLVPPGILFEHDILILDSFDSDETVWLDSSENLLLDE